MPVGIHIHFCILRLAVLSLLIPAHVINFLPVSVPVFMWAINR